MFLCLVFVFVFELQLCTLHTTIYYECLNPIIIVEIRQHLFIYSNVDRLSIDEIICIGDKT